MIKNSSKPSDGFTESPSSRPMTLRQQLEAIYNQSVMMARLRTGSPMNYMIDEVEKVCQEIAREAAGKAIADFVLTDDFRNAGGDITKLSPVILGFTELTQKPEEGDS